MNVGVKMLKGAIAVIVLTIAAALVGGYLILQSGLIPANADAAPGPVETWMARTSLDATLNREAPKGPNPITMTDTNLIDGINLYAQHRAGPGCLNRFSASISGASTKVRLPSGGAAA